jgi:hypothetical protein
MSRKFGVFAALAAVAVSATYLSAEHRRPTLAIVMTNDPSENQIKVYDTETQVLLQTLSTQGLGGVGGNARGVRDLDGELIAAVNNGSNSVVVFRRNGDGLRFQQLVSTTSAPVSIDFGSGHMYVAGATSVDSFALNHYVVEGMDGTTGLVLANGTIPPSGSTAQVGAVNDRELLVTLKTDPTPGTVDVVTLHDGAIAAGTPKAVSAPTGTLTPFGFSIYPDGTALITLAHSNQDGLFRNGAFTAVTAAGQNAPCWTTRDGKYVFTANAASRTISRLVGTGNNVFVDSTVAATIPTGGPADMDSDKGVLGVIDHAAGQSHLTLFTYNVYGELTALGSAITVGVPNANGVAIMAARDSDGR